MANIARCPQCAQQLGLPAVVEPTDRMECPECQSVFSLGETAQVALPIARVLESAENLDAPADCGKLPAEPIANATPADSTAEIPSSAPLKSWEERLKKALAMDDSETPASADILQDGPQDNLQDSGSQAASPQKRDPKPEAIDLPSLGINVESTPSFEFELDAPADTEGKDAKSQPRKTTSLFDRPSSPAAEPLDQLPQPSIKTLADFAATATQKPLEQKTSQVDSNLPAPEPPAAQGVVDKFRAPASSSATRPTSFEVSVSEHDEIEPSEIEHDESIEPAEHLKTSVYTVPNHHLNRRGFPKVAALVAGPVCGGLLGLYGLLWLQGAKADYVGLTRVLPTAMLPASVRNTSDEARLADARLPMPETADNPSDSLLAAQALLARPGATQESDPPQSASAPHRDGAIKPASATEPMSAMAVQEQTQISAAEFLALFEAANDAVPKFLEGDLSTQELVRRKGQAYISLCRLAEHFDFAQQLGLAPSVHSKAQQAKQIYQYIASHAKGREELSHIAARWWEYEQRPAQGMFLTGYVLKSQAVKSGTVHWIKLSKQANAPTIPVLLERQRFPSEEKIGIVGRVLTRSEAAVAGLTEWPAVKATYGFGL